MSHMHVPRCVVRRWVATSFSCYFGVTTFTTVGYGDIVPDNDIARIFTCIYALSGVACAGVALGVVGNNLINAQDEALKQAKRWKQSRVMGLFRANSFSQLIPEFQPTSKDDHENDDEMSTDSQEDGAGWDNCNCRFQDLYQHRLVVQLTIITILMVLIAHGIQTVEGGQWTFAKTVYFAIITGMYWWPQLVCFVSPANMAFLEFSSNFFSFD